MSTEKKQYTLSFGAEEIRIIQQGLLELPAKISFNLIRELDRQIQVNEQQNQAQAADQDVQPPQ